MPHTLTDAAHPLGAPEHGQLLPPPPPAPAAVARSTPAVVLYTVAGVITVLWLMNVAKGVPDPEVADASYRMGYLLGPLVLSVPLALAGLVVQLATRRRRVRVAEDATRAGHAVWERHHRVWQAAWLCRRCRVAFFPKGSVSPDYPASPAVAAAQLPMWVTTTAERAFGVPEPTGPR
ncbi:hypothetical protein OG689_02475 [Kitasatospora sp. NBC_00240]|uniref:hypothetical protein n=1 Tax=Kitasatospora sp. NBC_00240 TaxID=2903567 RepID=UPI0022524F4B|nr:hypothetical protein [Kitasatospora sp. NBC_00240]MCX5208183.1 hypothetical protein [Kitasatospora sp. NBC_00240]